MHVNVIQSLLTVCIRYVPVLQKFAGKVEELHICEPHNIPPTSPQAACHSRTLSSRTASSPWPAASKGRWRLLAGTFGLHVEATEPGQVFLRIFSWLSTVTGCLFQCFKKCLRLTRQRIHLLELEK